MIGINECGNWVCISVCDMGNGIDFVVVVCVEVDEMLGNKIGLFNVYYWVKFFYGEGLYICNLMLGIEIVFYVFNNFMLQVLMELLLL